MVILGKVRKYYTFIKLRKEEPGMNILSVFFIVALYFAIDFGEYLTRRETERTFLHSVTGQKAK